MDRVVLLGLLRRGELWLAGVVVLVVLLHRPLSRLGPYVWSMLRPLMIGRCRRRALAIGNSLLLPRAS